MSDASRRRRQSDLASLLLLCGVRRQRSRRFHSFHITNMWHGLMEWIFSFLSVCLGAASVAAVDLTRSLNDVPVEIAARINGAVGCACHHLSHFRFDIYY